MTITEAQELLEETVTKAAMRLHSTEPDPKTIAQQLQQTATLILLDLNRDEQ